MAKKKYTHHMGQNPMGCFFESIDPTHRKERLDGMMISKDSSSTANLPKGAFQKTFYSSNSYVMPDYFDMYESE